MDLVRMEEKTSSQALQRIKFLLTQVSSVLPEYQKAILPKGSYPKALYTPQVSQTEKLGIQQTLQKHEKITSNFLKILFL